MRQTPRASSCLAWCSACGSSSHRSDVRGLWALLTRFDRELHALSFVQLAIALDLDVGLMHEDIAASVLECNETEALGRVEPLDRSNCHVCVAPCCCRTTRNRRGSETGRRSPEGASPPGDLR